MRITTKSGKIVGVGIAVAVMFTTSQAGFAVERDGTGSPLGSPPPDTTITSRMGLATSSVESGSRYINIDPKVWSPELSKPINRSTNKLVKTMCYVSFTGFSGGPQMGEGDTYAIGKFGEPTAGGALGGLQAAASVGGSVISVPEAERSPIARTEFQLGISWKGRPRGATVVAHPTAYWKGRIAVNANVGSTGSRSSGRAYLESGQRWKDDTAERISSKKNYKPFRFEYTGGFTYKDFQRRSEAPLGTNLIRGHTYLYSSFARAQAIALPERFAPAQAQLDFGSKVIDAPPLLPDGSGVFSPGENDLASGVLLTFKVPNRKVNCP